MLLFVLVYVFSNTVDRHLWKSLVNLIIWHGQCTEPSAANCRQAEQWWLFTNSSNCNIACHRLYPDRNAPGKTVYQPACNRRFVPGYYFSYPTSERQCEVLSLYPPLPLSFSLARSPVGGRRGSASPSRGVELRHSVVSIYGRSLRMALARCHSNRRRCLVRRKGVGEVVAVLWGVHVPSGVFSVSCSGADHTAPICRARHKQPVLYRVLPVLKREPRVFSY